MPYKSDEFRAVKITTFKSQSFSYTYVLALILKMYVFIHLPMAHKLLVNVSLATSFGSNT